MVSGEPDDRAITTPLVTQPKAASSDPGPGPWNEVGKRGRIIKRGAPSVTRASPSNGEGKEPHKRTAATGAKPPNNKPSKDEKMGGALKKENQNGKEPPKRKPPRSAAVTLTCPPDKYAEAMKIARENINLKELGIPALRPKRATTGAIILEVPGPNGAERALALKDKMAEALKTMEGVRVARPVKMADLRVRDLIESTSIMEVKETIASLGGCSGNDIKPERSACLTTEWAPYGCNAH